MYEFKTTEQNNTKANDYETKALLYLLSYRKDSKSIQTFAVDCFNDITGCNRQYSMLWDVQSKNEQSLTPRKIGKYLITLFLNFQHDFPFEHFIFFMPKLKEGYLQNENLKTFDLSNFKEKQSSKIKEGLIAEYQRRQKQSPDETQIDSFLPQVLFVLGEDSKIDYVKKITNFKTQIIQDKFFEAIFNEIRDKQTAFKNISIHNSRIENASEVVATNKLFKRTDFDTLIINRFIGFDLFKNLNNIPLSFRDSIRDFELEECKDIIQNIHSEIARVLFDKNNKRLFWLFFEELIITVKNNINSSPTDIRQVFLTNDVNVPSEFTELTVVYLIALIKDGWQSEEDL